MLLSLHLRWLGQDYCGVRFQKMAMLMLASSGRVDFLEDRPGRESFTSSRRKGIDFLEGKGF